MESRPGALHRRPCELDDEQRGKLERNGIRVHEGRVARLDGEDGVLQHVVFESGERLPRRALFFSTGQEQQSDLSLRLGCEINEKGTVRTGQYEATHLPGLYVAGDASRAVQWVIVAAAEGAEAAFAINTDLSSRSFAGADPGSSLRSLAFVVDISLPCRVLAVIRPADLAPTPTATIGRHRQRPVPDWATAIGLFWTGPMRHPSERCHCVLASKSSSSGHRGRSMRIS